MNRSQELNSQLDEMVFDPGLIMVGLSVVAAGSMIGNKVINSVRDLRYALAKTASRTDDETTLIRRNFDRTGKCPQGWTYSKRYNSCVRIKGGRKQYIGVSGNEASWSID